MSMEEDYKTSLFLLFDSCYGAVITKTSAHRLTTWQHYLGNIVVFSFDCY